MGVGEEMKFKTGFLSKVALPKEHVISLQEAQDRKYFGPVYHGTTSENRAKIDAEGFKVVDMESGETRNGYSGDREYSQGLLPPIHHLGAGTYFTTVKSIAQMYNEGTAKGLRTYYLDVPRLETINFASPNTMMKWWIKNGYNPNVAKHDRLVATKLMTEHLKTQFDAVWYKGKTIRKVLDGDQIVVFDPSRVYEIDSKLSKPGEVGSKVTRKSDGMRGVVTKRENIERILEEFPAAASWVKPGAKWRLWVRWQKGGSDFNVQDVDVDFL